MQQAPRYNPGRQSTKNTQAGPDTPFFYTFNADIHAWCPPYGMKYIGILCATVSWKLVGLHHLIVLAK